MPFTGDDAHRTHPRPQRVDDEVAGQADLVALGRLRLEHVDVLLGTRRDAGEVRHREQLLVTGLGALIAFSK